MSMDLTGITNKNEYYTNHYFSTVFEENTRATISGWNAAARESEEIKTPWSLLRQNARQYYTAHDKFVRSSVNLQVLAIAPNLTWKQAYEDMVEKRSLGKDKQAQILVYEVEQRIKYEIMLEFGLAGNIGRTLEKSNCSVISFATEDIIRIADAVQERTINELGVLTAENSDSFKRMVIGYLNLMRTNGAFEDKVFDEYTMGDGNGYMLSNDRNRWLPGRQSGRNTPRFIAEHIGNGRSSFEFDSPAANKYVDWIASCCNEVLVDDSTFRAISKFILDEAVKQNVISLVPSSVNYKIYGLNKERVFITDDVMQMRCDKCGSV